MNRSSGKIIILFCILAAVTLVMPGLSSKKTSVDVVMFGDSIYGNFRDDTSISALIGNRFNVSCLNAGLGGTTMSYQEGDSQVLAHENASSMVAITDAFVTGDFSYVLAAQPARNDGDLDYFDSAVESISQTDLSKARLIIIEQGLNDHFYQLPTGEDIAENSVYDYKGAVSYVVMNMQKRYPDAKILLASPVYGKEDISVYADIMKAVADKYGVYFCDMNAQNIVNAENLYDVTDDGTHLNEKGRQIYADVLGAYIESNHIL